MCGSWWSGTICPDGTPNGYAAYEIRGEEVTWRYKSTGFDLSHQLRVYPRGLEYDGSLYSCDHFVDPAHLLGNIRQTPLASLLASPEQRRFG